MLKYDDEGRTMNVLANIVNAFIAYFGEVRDSRIAFWLKKKSVPSSLELVSGPITALTFLLPRHFFAGLPSPWTYGVLIISYVVLTSFAAGVTCLLIAPARQLLGNNMRKFISTSWIISTIAALVSLVDSLFGATEPFSELLQQYVWDNEGTDVIATYVPSVIIGLGIVALKENLLEPPFPRDRHYILATVFFFLAGIAGLGLMIGGGRNL
jgi:hypothetical protein